MEMLPHCTVLARRPALDLLRLSFLTLAVLLVHGFHPWAEDGGLYVAGVEHLLDPTLFPGDRAFVAAPLRFSLFAPCVAAPVRLLHISLAGVLLGLYLFTTALMLWAALRLARRCFPGEAAAWSGVMLLAAWWTLPVAGTSLLLMDPYLTARSLSTPLTLLALDEVLQLGREPVSFPRAPALRCLLWLALLAAFHPLMAIYAAGFMIVLCLVLRKAPVWCYALLAGTVFVLGGALQGIAAAESAAVVAAIRSRYYWFLSQWQWFEWLGLPGPLLVLALLSHGSARSGNPCRRALCRSGILFGLLATAVSVVFAQEHDTAHAVARLQPLRSFLPIYALLPILLGGALSDSLPGLLARFLTRQGHPAPRAGLRLQRAELRLQRAGLRLQRAGLRLMVQACPWGIVAAFALMMFGVQRITFPASPHIEWPGRPNPNPWVEAFVWARGHTPETALFALDARYINTPGEDAQGFRALAHRSALPDFSKDGGQAANHPELAPAWERAATATADLSRLTDAQRKARLYDFGVDWIVLHADAVTALPCPYRNPTVKVCRL